MIWDVDIRKQFTDSEHRFELSVQFRTSAKRVVLFGPSGAGKSQTLRMIAGLSQPDTGHIHFNGSCLFNTLSPSVNLPPQKRKMAYVFQDYALFPHLTVLQNISFTLCTGFFNPGKQMQNETVRHWLKVFELEAIAHQYPHQISGGQRQRTALARALVSRPQALLLDEPFAALDQGLRVRLREEFMALQAQLDTPVILITHDQDDVEYFAETVVHIENGHCTPITDNPSWS